MEHCLKAATGSYLLICHHTVLLIMAFSLREQLPLVYLDYISALICAQICWNVETVALLGINC
jgi:hypothetical protein